MQNLAEQKQPLVNEKRLIEAELVQLNVDLMAEEKHSHAWNVVNSKRGVLVKRKSEVEIKISEIKSKVNKLNIEHNSAKIDLKKKPNEAVKAGILELRDKYLSFAADTTRVSSMRAMASRFVEETQLILALIP